MNLRIFLIYFHFIIFVGELETYGKEKADKDGMPP